ncbi:cysteine-rich CWC family protein [Marinicellulosiphila megalodicopiae]|uniref:cysteine-rich CWC family protein n=1 Tax=Marinicellulosiphila megalodicopiae TaxID=2724896 RepID=UPI003BB097A0
MKTHNPTLCPKCQKENQCSLAISKDKTKKDCWCMNPDLKFPKALIDELPKSAKNKSCICLSCAQSFERKPSN